MAYNELIKDINRIRDYIRNFYVYGFRSREEYASQKKTFPPVKASDSKGAHDLVFHEVYSAYYNAIARILTLAVQKELTPRKLMKEVQRKGFAESTLYIPDRLLSEEWPFLTDQLLTDLKKKPTMPLTRIQKRWLRSIMEDPRIHLFLDDSYFRKLQSQLEDVQPLFVADSFCYYDRFSDGDPYTDEQYIRNFKTVRQAISCHQQLTIVYQNRFGVTREMAVLPTEIEYSVREDKFRFYAGHPETSEWKEPLRLNMNRLISCTLLSDRSDGDLVQEIEQDSAVIELYDVENALERAMFQFSFLEKQTERVDDKTYRMTLYYPKADQTEVLIRILSFGDQMKVITEGYLREEIQKRILKQVLTLHPERNLHRPD